MLAFITTHASSILLALTGAFFIVGGICVFLFIRYRQLTSALAHLMRGKKTASLEDVIMSHTTDIDHILDDITLTKEQLADIRKTLTTAVLHKHVVRYNPFKDLGGDQSFAVALLDANADGVVISSLHTRDGTRVYAKPIASGTSTYKLSAEEETAVREARTPSAQ